MGKDGFTLGDGRMGGERQQRKANIPDSHMVRAWSKVEAVKKKKGKEKRHFPERNELNLVNGPHTVKQLQLELQQRGWV